MGKRRKADGLVFAGKRNDEDGAKEKLYTYASHVVVDSFKVRLFVCYTAYQKLNSTPGS